VEQFEEEGLRKVVKRVDLKKPKRVHKHFRTCRRCLNPFVTFSKYSKNVCDACVKPRGFVDKNGNRRVML